MNYCLKPPPTTVSTLVGSSTKTEDLVEDTATTITQSSSDLPTTSEHQITQPLTPYFTSSINPENTYQTSYQTPKSSTSTTVSKEPPPTTVSPLVGSSAKNEDLVEDTATTITQSSSDLPTTSEHQIIPSLTPGFTSSINPENTYQTSYQTPTSSTSSIRRKEPPPTTVSTLVGSSTKTEDLVEDTATTITQSSSDLPTTSEHQITQSLTPNLENTYQTPTSSTNSIRRKEPPPTTVSPLPGSSAKTEDLVEDTATTITQSSSDLPTTSEHQITQSLTPDFTSFINLENTYQTSYQKLTSSTSTTLSKEPPPTTVSPLDGSSTKTEDLVEDTATTITQSSSDLPTTSEHQIIQSLTPDFTSSINPENTHQTSYQTPTSSTSSIRRKETPPTTVSPLVDSTKNEDLVEDTATTITQSSSDLPSTSEHQITQSLTPDFTSSLNPENTYQTSYQTPTSSTSSIRRKEPLPTTVSPLVGSSAKTEDLVEDTATTITQSSSDLPTTSEHQITQSLTPGFTSSLNPENTYQTSYQTLKSSTSTTVSKETPPTTVSPLVGSSTKTEVLVEDTATTITQSSLDLPTTSEHQIIPSLTSDFTSSINPENMFQTSYQTPKSSTSTTLSKEPPPTTVSPLVGSSAKTEDLVEDTATTITQSSSDLPTTSEQQITQSLTPGFTSSINPENTYQTSYQTPTSSTSSIRRKEPPPTTVSPLDGSSTKTEDLVEDTATTITQSSSDLPTTSEHQITQSLTPDFTSSINLENTHQTSYQTPKSSTSTTLSKEPPPTTVSPLVGSSAKTEDLVEDTATTITQSSSDLPTTSEHQIIPSLTPGFTSSINPENTYQTSYQTPTSSTSSIRRKEPPPTTVSPLDGSSTKTEDLVEDTATTITQSSSDLPTTSEHQITQSLTPDFTSSINPENTYQTSYQTLTSSTSSIRRKETPPTTVSPLVGSSTKTEDLVEDTATTITQSSSHLPTTSEDQITQSLTPDITSSINLENTHQTSYQTSKSSTSSLRRKETPPTTVSPLVGSSAKTEVLVEDTATTITQSSSDLPTTSEHQITQSLTPDFTSSINPENTYQTSYQTPTSSTSSIRRKETSLFEDTALTITGSNLSLSTTTEQQINQSLTKEPPPTTVSPLVGSSTKTEDLVEDTATTITQSSSDLPATSEHQITQSLTPDFTSPINPENTHQTSYQTPKSSTSTTLSKETPGNYFSPLHGSSTQTQEPHLYSKEMRRFVTNLQLCLHSETDEEVILESLQNFVAKIQEKLRKELCKDCTLRILQIQPK
ncbi:mucin-3A-like [Tachysurus fulvidraco]|uniref:mucin-3A-like n=1 Tax=Tachysurus fulvidraco TaxID=1234273 RepID=UPI001FEFF4B9|nr:mucin-3A-like [Tachysurus fulvidraco]